jgi:hypothetical protein
MASLPRTSSEPRTDTPDDRGTATHRPEPRNGKSNGSHAAVVLVELFGLIVLFTVDRPYNWLGALFILCGQYLQRLERRRLQKRGEAALRRRYGHSQIP